jgi:hypothetical protein
MLRGHCAGEKVERTLPNSRMLTQSPRNGDEAQFTSTLAFSAARQVEPSKPELTSTADFSTYAPGPTSTPQDPTGRVPAYADCTSRAGPGGHITTDAKVEAFSIVARGVIWPVSTSPRCTRDYCWKGTKILLTNTAGSNHVDTGDDRWACREELRKCSDRGMRDMAIFTGSIFSTVSVAGC